MTATVSDESGAGSSLEENLEDDPVLEEILKGDPDGSQLLADLTAKTQYENRALLAEWRSLKQMENGSPSTSPPYWDTDDDGEGAKPSELHGKHTWRIEKFSQINKRELRSDTFEAGGYQWYILIYPQGCDVCNHLSLFLCVANHDKLLPGWSHFAQFTIAVVNKDPKKSKYSDTLHRFWKKEHDWGWKKFMELSKVFDGFIDSDALVIKAQVQVIRERADRPFRCLDCQYRRELVRVYLSNVEQICRKFVEEKRTKLKELIEDKVRWSSFCTFWSGMDQNVRRRMSREKTGVILKVVVKHFFIEKEVTSTLVMDSLYSGLKALESQSRCDKARMETDEIIAPIVHVEKDMFVLVDDVLLLLERAAMEPLPPKDDKGPQNRTKDGITGEECNLLSIERDETRLTEMGRRTVETFVLAHIFSRKIEVAHQEAVALKRQEELIREEEEAWLIETEQKAKRKVSEKEKKSKQKQAKQKRNNRKVKDKGRDESVCATVLVREVQENANDEIKDLIVEQTRVVVEKLESPEEISDVSDSVDYVAENFQPDIERRDPSPLIWDELLPPIEACSSGISSISSVQEHDVLEKKCSSAIDDSSSTCSTDSVPSVIANGRCKGNSLSNSKIQKLPRRGKNPRGKYDNSAGLVSERDEQPSASLSDGRDLNDIVVEKNDASDQIPACIIKKNTTKVDSSERKQVCSVQEDAVVPVVPIVIPSSRNLPRNSIPSTVQPVVKMESRTTTTTTTTTTSVVKKSTPKPEASTPSPKPEALKAGNIKPQVPPMSRPSSTPPRPPPLAVSTSASQAPPGLARSLSAAGWLALPDPSPRASYAQPQSYRNAIVGNNNTNVSLQHYAAPLSYSQQPVFVHQSPPSERNASFSVGNVKCDLVAGHEGGEASPPSSCSSLVDDIQKLDFYGGLESADACTSGRIGGSQGLGLVADDFPHLDIINDLLDDEQGTAAGTSNGGGRAVNRYYSFPGDIGDAGCCGYTYQVGVGSQMNPFNEFLAPHGNRLYNGGQQMDMDGQRWHMAGGGGSDGREMYAAGGYQLPHSVGNVNGYGSGFRPSNGY